MTDVVASPMVMAGDKMVTQLRQVTITADEDIAQVNDLLRDGWRLMNIGYHANATVYVLGQMDEKPRHRPGFLGAE
jgi:hypothetical protein